MRVIDAVTKNFLGLRTYNPTDAINVKNVFFDFEVIRPDIDAGAVFSTPEHPVNYGENFLGYTNSVSFNEETYFKDPNLKNIFLDICKKTQQSSFLIDSANLINKDVLVALASNPNIKELKLAYKGDNPYYLTLEDYEILKNSGIETFYTAGVVPELEENFDPRIAYNKDKKLIDYYTHEDLVTKDELFISHLDPKSFPNVKYINENANITITSGISPRIVIDFLKLLEKSNHIGEIAISVDNKEEFNKILFEELDELKLGDNVMVHVNGDDMPISQYAKYEVMLFKMVEEAQGLSPFLKFLYAYNKVKKFKEYKESNEGLFESRDIYKILENDCIVCVGFSKLLVDLLHKLGIEASYYSVAVDNGLDDVKLDFEPLGDDIETKSQGHARLKVNLVDPKFGINGYYTSDPTWDNSMKHDLYAHALMTTKESNHLDRYNFYNHYSIHEVLDSETIEEFYIKTRKYFDKKKNDHYSKTIHDYFVDLFTALKQIDIRFLDELKNKFGDLAKYGRTFTIEELSVIIPYIAKYIVTKDNRKIPGDTLKAGITSLYRDVYKDPNYLENVPKIIEINRKYYDKVFPQRFKQKKDGTIEEFINEENKFDSASFKL